MTNLIVPETADTTVNAAIDTARLGTYEVAESVHEVDVGGKTIQVTLREPIGASGQHPGVVMLHGTGTSTHKAFARETDMLTSAGVVTAVPDKLMDSYSTVSRDYEELAAGYEAVAKWLRAQDSVYSRAVGYYAQSEGALVAPIAVANDPHTQFLILVSDPVLPIREQGALAADAYLRKIGAPERLYQAIPRLISGAIADGNFLYANFDPGPYHEKIRVPVMMLYGTNDLSMPIVQGPLVLREQLADNGNDQIIVRYYQGADHSIKVDGEFVRQAYQDIADYVNGLPTTATAEPRVAGAQPHQDFVAQTVDTPRWFGSGDAMLAILFSGVLITIIGGIITVWSRRTQTYRGVGRPMLSSSLLIVVTWAAFLGYVVLIADLALSYEQNRWVVQGGWLIVQLLALAAVFLVVRAYRIWRSRPMFTRRAGTNLRVLLTGQVLLLFALAYWGVYPSVFGM